MAYEHIIKVMESAEGFATVLLKKKPVAVKSLADGAAPHFLRALFEAEGKGVFCVCDTDFDAKRMYADYPYDKKTLLPSPTVEFHTIDLMSSDISVERAAAINEMAREPRVVFLSMEAMLYKMRPKASFSSVTLVKGADISLNELFGRLTAMGYRRAEVVESQGQMSGRGQIAEVWPASEGFPLRIVTAYDEIETIKAFDPDSQRSFGEKQSVTIGSATDMPLDEKERAGLADELERRGLFRQADELRDTGGFPNINGAASLVENSVNADSYMDGARIVFCDMSRLEKEFDERNERRNTLLAAALSDGSAAGFENDCYDGVDGLLERTGARAVDIPALTEHKFFKASADMGTRSAVSFMGNMERAAEAIAARIESGWKVYIYSGGHGRQISAGLAENGVETAVCDTGSLGGPGAGIVRASLPKGFEAESAMTLFVSENELLNKRREKGEKKHTKNRDSFLADLKPGDIVVHEVHGKGRFIGLKTMETGGAAREYMEIEYKGGDKLYIKTDQIDRIDKYVGPGDGEMMQLSKLGGKEWENAKTKAKTSIKKMAEDLLDIYAERSSAKGHRYSKDTVWQAQFEDNFIYEESEGQLTAIDDIKRDMESDKVMDRLLMGDVGYGKTEVAMRACMKAVMDSKQAAVLVPTTLLARQHFITFKERFEGFPVNIGLLSRFAEQNKATMEGVKNGTIDIVIGTHKLLSKQLEFHDLGLLVIDEEQRFGVSHKERIKDRKRDVDVLTLSATPIPRTLEMAMTGIRDMSTIDTPPKERKEVAAYVARFDWGMVREAILKEMDRGGQVYFVTRRIGNMDDLLLNLHQVVPEARVGVVHGQLQEKVFEKTVEDFLDGKYDVLLATTIIENGIDISSVNTLIVYEADKFGLAQLYQLKGRVGRSNIRAYVYFTHMGEESLSDDARKRLSAIKEFTRFGSGFKIAMRDLEIRGAGNVLGAEQSGHMSRIGYGLYCRLVKEQVAHAMGRPVLAQIETAVELAQNALIPTDYIEDESRRMEEYRRIAAVKTADDAKRVKESLCDMYGEPPQEVDNLIGAALIKNAAEAAGISGVIRHGKSIELLFAKEADVDLKKLVGKLALWGKDVMFRPSDPPSVVFTPKQKMLVSTIQLINDIGSTVDLTVKEEPEPQPAEEQKKSEA